MNFYTLIYAVCFYTSSLLLTVPFLKHFRHHEARFLSLLAASTASFILGLLIPFKIAFYSVTASLLAISLYIIHRERIRIDSSEVIFALIFGYFILLRFLNPYILDAEKFMDSAFMNAILKANSLPPNDPFLAGGKLDFYYYFGHLIGASITLLSLSPPEVGYNVAIAALPAYTSLLIYGILREKDRRIAFSGVFLSVFSGNLYSFVDFFNRIFSGKPIDGSYYWNCTRVIENTINEFPYFSFIHADLHAHVVAIPIFVLVIALILRDEQEKARYAALTLALFTLFTTNSWHYPLAVAGVMAAVLALRDKWLFISAALSALPAVLFFMHMNAPAAEFKLIEERSDSLQFLLYAFTPIAAAYAFTGKRYTFLSIPLSIPLYFLSPVLAFTAPLAVTSLYGIYRKDARHAILLSGVLALILPEFFAVESRLNTVFKFYIYAWVALMIASSANLEWQSRRKHFLALLLIIGIVYPLAATPVRYGTAELTLDGMSFMKAYDGDYYAIKWLQDKNGVIIEEGCTHGALCGYQYGGRVAAFTGNPAVIAWTNHEFAWRRNYTLVAERAKDVREFYTTSSCERMREITSKYGVEYIFYGYEERRIFSSDVEKFEKCFDRVFEFRGTYIFATKNLSFT